MMAVNHQPRINLMVPRPLATRNRRYVLVEIAKEQTSNHGVHRGTRGNPFAFSCAPCPCGHELCSERNPSNFLLFLLALHVFLNFGDGFAMVFGA
jgi:hypothetical protein